MKRTLSDYKTTGVRPFMRRFIDLKYESTGTKCLEGINTNR